MISFEIIRCARTTAPRRVVVGKLTFFASVFCERVCFEKLFAFCAIFAVRSAFSFLLFPTYFARFFCKSCAFFCRLARFRACFSLKLSVIFLLNLKRSKTIFKVGMFRTSNILVFISYQISQKKSN